MFYVGVQVFIWSFQVHINSCEKCILGEVSIEKPYEKDFILDKYATSIP